MKQSINLGTTANDRTGTRLRDAGKMINDNFSEVYSNDGGNIKIRVIDGVAIGSDTTEADITSDVGLTPAQAGRGYIALIKFPETLKAIQVISDGEHWSYSSNFLFYE